MAGIAAELGMPLMPWQRYVINVAHEVDPVTGFWVYDEVVVTVPRQAGKTTLKIPVYVHRLGRINRGQLWMTAQNGGKALDRWNSAREWMESSPLIAPRIKSKISIGHEQVLWLATLAKLRPFTPNDESLHGESPDLVDADEWWAFDQQAATELEQAYEPGFLTRNSQVWKTSTAGTPRSWGLNRDTLRGRQAVELGRRSGMAYFEWSLPDEIDGVELADLPDDELIEAAIRIHPAIGFHPTAPADRMRATVRSQFGKLGRDGFLRAWGNRTASDGRLQIIPAASWAAAVGNPIPPMAPVGLGFAIDPTHNDAAVAAAWRDVETGEATCEVLRYRPGTDWLVDELVAIAQRNEHTQVASNAIGQTLEVLDAVEARVDWPESWKILRLSAQQHGAACARVVKEATATPRPSFHHIAQAELTLSVENAGKRRVGTGGAWAWAATDTSVAPIDAVTAALWAADHPREVEPDKGKFWIR